jgi:hypothetical protein
MKGRLLWATILPSLALLGAAISPGHGQAARLTDSSSVTGAPAAAVMNKTMPAPTVVRKGLRYFRFNAGQCLPETATPRDAGTAGNTAIITLPNVREPLRATGEAARRGAGDVGARFTDTIARLKLFGNWCRNTAFKVADLYHVIADSCRRLHEATAGFSSSEARAAVLPAADALARPAANQAALSSRYQYLWENERGDCICSLDPKFDPNRGGPPVWRRVK